MGLSSKEWAFGLLLCFFVLCHSVQAQEPVYRSLTEDDGLPSNTVYDMLLDGHGHRWFGTAKGLARYDGHRFEVFRAEGQKGNACTDLVEGGGRIWCVNFARQVFFVENDTLHELTSWNGNNKLGLLDIDFNPADNCLYVASGNGVFQYELSTGKWKLLTDPADSTVFMWNIVVADGSVYGFNNGNKTMRLQNGKLQTFNSETEEELFIQTVQKHHNKAFVSFVNRPNWYSWENDGLKMTDIRINLPVDGTTRYGLLAIDRSGQQWLSKGEEIYVSHSPYRPIFKDISASGVMLDKEGQYWLTTLNKGVVIIPDLNLLRHDQNSSVRALVKTETDIQLLNDNGITALDGSKHLSFPKDVVDPTGAWFLNITNEWLVSGKSFHLIKGNELRSELKLGSVKDVMQTKDAVFIASNLGLWMRAKGQTEQLLSSGRCYSLLEGQDHILAGFDNGLRVISKADFTQKTLDASLFVSCMARTSNGRIWIGTQGFGLKELIGTELKNISLPSGFQNISKLKSDDDLLFAVGENGILRFDLRTNKKSVINRADGLPTHDISDMEIHDGRVFLSTSKGIFSFPTDMVAENTNAPNVNIRLRNSSVPITKEKTEYSHRENTFSFELSTDAARHQDALKFKYRMIGSGDAAWRETPFSVPGVTFGNLQAGKYTFEAVAMNEDGIESETPATYSFSIRPAFYQTWWFKLLNLLLLFLAIAGLFEWRKRVNTRKAAEELEQSQIKEQLTAYQLKALRAQMNPHFIFNALNTLQRYIMTNDRHAAGEYLGRFSDLMRTFLSLSEKETVTVAEELETLQLYLDIEKQRMGDDFHFEIFCEENLDQMHVPSMLIQPVVENAIKHGLLHRSGEKRLEISFAQSSNGLQIVVKDNGIGRQRSKEINQHRENHRSFGLKAVEERIKLINQNGRTASIGIEDLRSDTGTAEGTRVTLLL